MNRGEPWAAAGRRLSAAQAFQQAGLCHQQGNLAEAERLYRLVLKADRNHFDTLYRLGLVQAQQGKFEEGVKQIRRALYQRPNSAAARSSLATLLLAQNRHEEAVAEYRKALALDPAYFEANANLAVVLQGIGRAEEALAHGDKALAVEPGSPVVLNTLGNALCRLGRWQEAIARYQRSIDVAPQYPDAQIGLGSALLGLGRAEEAMAHFEKALALNPEAVDAHANLGSALTALDRYQEALPHYRAALALRPDHAQAQHGLGVVLGALGDIAAAGEAYRQAIRHDPRNPAHYLGLVSTVPVAADDSSLAALEALARDPGALSEEARTHLHFALAKAYADLRQEDKAMPQLVMANGLKRRQIDYDEVETLGRFARTAAVFTPALMGARAGGGDPGGEAVFVLGMPRSGSTLVEQILASHPQVFAAGELIDFEETLSAALGAAGLPAWPEAAGSLTAVQLREVGAEYRRRVRSMAPQAARIIDKMPANFRFAGLIHLALPNARIIHTVRDPIDTCLSCFQQLFVGNLGYAYDLGELGRYYRAYQGLMRHWHQVLPAGTMLDVHYEAVVADLEGEARRIVAHCGLPWDDACLAFHQTRRIVKTASAAQVRRPLYGGSVGRSRAYPDLVARLSEALAG